MTRWFVWGVSTLCLLAGKIAVEAYNATKATRRIPAEELEVLGIWGHIHCDPSILPNLSITLNGMTLNSTLLPALPPKGSIGGPQVGKGIPSKVPEPAAEFRLPPLLPGSYLLEVLHPDVIFPKYRAIINSSSNEGATFEVYRLNEYLVPSSTDPVSLPLMLGPVGFAQYVPPQGGFSVFDLLRQPLVILIFVSLGIMYFLPKMQEVQMEEERQQQLQQYQEHDQHIVDAPYTDGTESLFVEKLMRQGGS